MPRNVMLALTLPIVVVLAGCVGGGDNTVNTQTELEETLDTDIDGDGSVEQNGVEIGS